MVQLAHQAEGWVIFASSSAMAGFVLGALEACVVLAVSVVVLALLAGGRRFRAMVRDADARRHRDARERRRIRTLHRAGVPSWNLSQLTCSVREVERRSPADAAAFDLEGLLDRYVDLECEQKRIERVLASMEATPPALPEAAAPGSRRHELLRRRQALLSRAQARATAVAEDVRTTTELIHLIAHRSAFSDSELDMSAVDSCLEHLAAEDEVRGELVQQQPQS